MACITMHAHAVPQSKATSQLYAAPCADAIISELEWHAGATNMYAGNNSSGNNMHAAAGVQ